MTVKTNSNVVQFYRPTNDVLMKLLCVIAQKEKMCFFFEVFFLKEI